MAKSINTVTTPDGVTLHYETTGQPSPSRPTLLFHHYYGGSPATFHTVLSQPDIERFHSISYHARGWAPSTGPLDPEENAYSIAKLSADLAAVVSATNLADPDGAGFVIVGHSMGAKVAQHYAATHNDDASSLGLKGLILVAPAPLSGLDFPADARAQQRAAYQSAEGVRFVLDHVLTAGPGCLSEEVKSQCVRDSMSGNEGATAAWPEYACAENYGDLEGDIGVPVIVLRGDKDFERSLLGKDEVGAERGWENRVVEGCGHLVPLEKPRWLAGEISRFVQRVK
ncbi:alpha/beta-hydrolase [Xylaria arbuscula]|nr:alpha/beta-hydrolase [Xylaria arbuscula]